MNTSIYKIMLIYTNIYIVVCIIKCTRCTVHHNTYILNCVKLYCVIIIGFFSDRQSVSQLVIHLSSNTVSRFSVTVVYSKVNRKIKFFIGIPCFVSGNSTDLLILIYLLTFVYVHLDHCQTRTQCSA